MIGEDGYILLIDFGMAKIIEKNELAKTYGGTGEYMAPEMVARRVAYDKNIDWWAVGVIMFELLTGKTPFIDADRRE